MKNKLATSLSTLVLFLSAGCIHQETLDYQAQRLLRNREEIRRIFGLREGDIYEMEISETRLQIVIQRKDKIEIITYKDKDGSYDIRTITTIPRQIQYRILPPKQPVKPGYRINPERKLNI